MDRLKVEKAYTLTAQGSAEEVFSKMVAELGADAFAQIDHLGELDAAGQMRTGARGTAIIRDDHGGALVLELTVRLATRQDVAAMDMAHGQVEGRA